MKRQFFRKQKNARNRDGERGIALMRSLYGAEPATRIVMILQGARIIWRDAGEVGLLIRKIPIARKDSSRSGCGICSDEG